MCLTFVSAQGPRVTPTSGPCGHVERGFAVVSPALETQVPTAGGVGLRQSYLPRFAETLNLGRLNART